MQRLPPVLHGQAAPRRLGWPSRAVRAPLRPAQGRKEVDPQQRARILLAKLTALVNATAGPEDRRSVAFPGGAALTGVDGTWVLADADPVRSLGPALAVARQANGNVHDVNVVVDDRDAAGVLARRAGEFAAPPGVWRVDGAELVPAEVQPLPLDRLLDARVAPFADMLAAAGADPVVEHGRLIGEVHGLEVARVVVDERGPHIEVGVGRFDREAHALLSSDRPMEDTLRSVVELVRRHRTLDAEPHPLKLLAPARWLRSRLLHDPSLVGADHLAPFAPTVEAPDLRTPWPAPATGIDNAGQSMVVVCSTGIDLDLVPAAADARRAAFPHANARLVLAVPPRDVHPVTQALAAALVRPADVVAVP